MRNRGPGQWREWRWGNQVLPLHMPDPKAPVPEGQKPLSEVAYLTMRALMAKNSLAKLTDAVADLVANPESTDDTRISEARFRNALKAAAANVCSPEELEAIFPQPPDAVQRTPSRRPSRMLRRPSMKPGEG
mmetsp:Transcript_21162/g.46670  ORF Transcript_21162/g.46670 Transcript_21162/m.46670 type:complete len:132 (+) Transcript_21162:68-463(+)